MVLVIVMVQDPAAVAAVVELVPVQAVYCVPLAAALPRFVVTLVRSVLTLAKIEMILPATGAVLEVSVVLVWVPAVAKLLTKLAHCVAVTVFALATTLVTAVCPQPLSVEPTAQMSFKLALAVPPDAVFPTKPL